MSEVLFHSTFALEGGYTECLNHARESPTGFPPTRERRESQAPEHLR